MSGGAGIAVQAALVAAMRAEPAIKGLTAVFDAAPVRSALPYAVIEEPVVADWSAVGVEGREARIAVTFHDAGERPARIRPMLAEAEARVLELVRGDISEGWRVVGVSLLRSRVVAAKGERWVGTAEFRVRVWRPG